MKGAKGFLLVGLLSTEPTTRSRVVIACAANSASELLFKSYLSSFVPAKFTSLPSNTCPLGVFKDAFTDQYSFALKTSISISLSTINRKQTDCTLPADLAPGNLRHKTGDRLKPTR